MNKPVFSLVALLLASVTQASIPVYVSATRTVTARSSTVTSTSLGVFDESRSSTVFDPSPPFTATSTASSAMHSEFLSDQITYSGSVSVFDSISASSGSGSGSAAASLVVRFTLTEASSYSLVGPSSTNGFGGFLNERLFFVDTNTNVFNYSAAVVLPSLSGVLAPGTYELTASFQAGVSGVGTSSSTSTFNRQLFVPAPSALGMMMASGLALARRRRAH